MGRYRLTIGDKTFEVEVLGVQGEQARVLVNGRTYEVKYQSLAPGPAVTTPQPPPVRPAAPVRPLPTPRPAPPAAAAPEPPGAPEGPGAITAPMPGAILDVLVMVGDRVQAGDTVVKLEAMKMENDLQTPIAGEVKKVLVRKGDNVSVGEILVVVSGE